ncbi:MAG: J domain-containing protein [Deltaproteobacteria bacterium]|nr:J domain-containing protein [Deltaproteobacteria bacterium]
MTEEGFVDYYELLQLNPNADGDTIERVFRHLAKKYHPDHPSSGDEDRFRLILKAYRTLSNPDVSSQFRCQPSELLEHEVDCGGGGRNRQRLCRRLGNARNSPVAFIRSAAAQHEQSRAG